MSCHKNTLMNRIVLLLLRSVKPQAPVFGHEFGIDGTKALALHFYYSMVGCVRWLYTWTGSCGSSGPRESSSPRAHHHASVQLGDGQQSVSRRAWVRPSRSLPLCSHRIAGNFSALASFVGAARDSVGRLVLSAGTRTQSNLGKDRLGSSGSCWNSLAVIREQASRCFWRWWCDISRRFVWRKSLGSRTETIFESVA